jgi:transcriptional regulator with XRE-family HTH domain
MADRSPCLRRQRGGLIRSQCGLTQAQMAVEMGCSERKVWEWENQGTRFHFQNKLQREKLMAMMDAARAAQQGDRYNPR